MSLPQYYKAFKSLLGALAALVAAFPMLGRLFPTALAKYMFPPLGDIEPIARVGTVGAVGLATYVVYFFRSHKTDRSVLVVYALATISFAAYLTTSTCFMRKMDIPAEKTAVFVSVGFERTQFAENSFGNEDDWEMLRDRGFDEESIRKLWTVRSLVVARIMLWMSFTSSLVFVAAAFGLGILSEQKPKQEA